MAINFQDSYESLGEFTPPPDQLSGDLSGDRADDRSSDGLGTTLETIAADYQEGFAHRRFKAAFVLTVSWGLVFWLYQVSWGSSAVIALTALLTVQAVRLVKARPHPLPLPLSDADCLTAPTIALVGAAKNEEMVIEALVQQLLQVDYPPERSEIWIVDDNSNDRTPEILHRLQQEYPRLKVLRRSPEEAKGGKSGALNAVLTQTNSDVVAVFDADAQIPADMVRQVIPLFQQSPQVGAVQVRKAICNSGLNFWTKGQSTEMMLDSFFQQQRISYTGIGELRGNGQFIRRTALRQCGNFNEETITDDLDLTLRLHLNRWDIQFCLHPGVGEEGVTGVKGLWNQRNRWAEGGYQRYLDYWRLILQNRMGTLKTIDLVSFWIIQYLLPSIAVPDLCLALLRHRLPILTPISGLALSLTVTGLFVGVGRVYRVSHAVLWESEPSVQSVPKEPIVDRVVKVLRGFVYMLHWFAIMGFTILRMSVLPKRLKWVKTVHYGTVYPLQKG